MHVDFSTELNALNGEPIEYLAGKNKFPLTLGKAAKTALTIMLSPQKSRIDIDVPGDVKFDRYKLASKIVGATKPLELSIDDVKKIKDRIGEVCDPEVVGAAWKILDPVE